MRIKLISRNVVLLVVLMATAFACTIATTQEETRQKPNIVIIFADDMGYGDVGVFGHPTIKTPQLDRLATEGQKWTNFYVAAPVCTPSRAGLMTGRLPIRTGMTSDKRGVLFPDSKGGLPENEITIASALKQADYSTAIIGKWHLGHLQPFDPNSHGFDYYFGIPYSNDMDYNFPEGVDYFEACNNPKEGYFNVPLKRNRETIEQPAKQGTITRRYTEEAVKYIGEHKDGPFFLYLAHSMPHVPLFPSDEFRGTSERGTYGDVIEEIDWSVGKVIDALKENGLDDNTLVIFTSDNGPWLLFNENGGSAGLLRGGKGGTYEGGMREPTVFWGPGMVDPGVVSELGTTMDLLPTFCKMAGVELPDDRIYDGYDITSVITEKAKSPREEVFYYAGTQLYAVRKGVYKAHFVTRPATYGVAPTVLEVPELYNLSVDPSEKYDIAEQHLDVVEELRELAEAHKATVVPVVDQLDLR
nr:sulfatase [uncultured Draconibacterium sp.]